MNFGTERRKGRTNAKQVEAANAAADPPLLPPADTGSFTTELQGDIVGPEAEKIVAEPIPNSSMLVLPITIAPSASRRLVTVES